MSDSKTSPTAKRNLPSWMSSRENGTRSRGKKPADVKVEEESGEGGEPKKAKGHGRTDTGTVSCKGTKSDKKSATSSSGTGNFSKLLEGVVFVLSGFVNPERSILRSQALEMGAEYQPDWNSDCTLLVCAFPNTPKFRQVEADCGTIVSKEWISECYTEKKLVDIETYLMHAGKPWRKSNISHEASHGKEMTPPRKSQKQVEKKSHAKPNASAPSKSGASNPAKEHFPPSKVKKWVIDDLNRTISWLESQEEKPEASEIKNIAAEGILTCLQDAIDSLEQKQDIRQMTEQWSFIPHVVEELAKLDGAENSSTVLTKEDLCRQAISCKRIYEVDLKSLNGDSSAEKKKLKTGGSERGDSGKTEVNTSDAAAYDSDETLEMTEEEIDLAYKTIASKNCKC